MEVFTMNIYREVPRNTVGVKRGGYDARVERRHEQSADRADLSDYQKLGALEKALRRLEREYFKSPLKYSDLMKEAARSTLNRSKEDWIKLCSTQNKKAVSRTVAEDKASVLIHATTDRLIRQGNAPTLPKEPKKRCPVKGALLRLKSAVKFAGIRGDKGPLVDQAKKIAGFSPDKAKDFFLGTDKAIRQINHFTQMVNS
jgi:hypothetical protein